MSIFEWVERREAKLRLAVAGPSGTGKTALALLMAREFGKQIAVMDSERGSVKKSFAAYTADKRPAVKVVELQQKTPAEYLATIAAAAAEGFDALVIDSYSHSWIGALEVVDRMGGQKFTNGWKTVSPQVTKLVDAILSYPGHVIVTMRSHSDFALETNAQGKVVPKKIGMKTVARDGTDYEFDVMLDMNTDNTISVTKSRCPALNGVTFTRPNKPGEVEGDEIPVIIRHLKAWLSEGAPISPRNEALERIKFATDESGLALAREFIKANKDVLTAEDHAAIKDAYLAKKQAIADDVVDV